MKQVQQHIHDWTISYQRRNHTDEPIPGESILGELDGVVYIIDYYLSQLQDVNDHKKTNFNREGGQNFDKKETSFFFKKSENMPRYELVYFSVQIIRNELLINHCVFDAIHSKISE